MILISWSLAIAWGKYQLSLGFLIKSSQCCWLTWDQRAVKKASSKSKAVRAKKAGAWSWFHWRTHSKGKKKNKKKHRREISCRRSSGSPKIKIDVSVSWRDGRRVGDKRQSQWASLCILSWGIFDLSVFNCLTSLFLPEC